MRASELKEMLSRIVREEVSRQLPGMVERVLTERYLRRLVSESVGTTELRPRRVAEDSYVDDDREDAPAPLTNTDRGAYQDGPLTKRTEARTPLTSPDNPLSFLYEGLDTIPRGPVSGPEGEGEGIPLKVLGGDFGKMRQLVKAMEGRSSSRGSARPAPRPAPAPTPTQARRQSLAASLIEGPVFPDAPIELD